MAMAYAHARPASTRSMHMRVLLDPLHGLVAVLLVLAIAAACVALRALLLATTSKIFKILVGKTSAPHVSTRLAPAAWTLA